MSISGIQIVSWNDTDRTCIIAWGNSKYEYQLGDGYERIKASATTTAIHSVGRAANYIKRRSTQERKLT